MDHSLYLNSQSVPISLDMLRDRIDRLLNLDRRHFERLWNYYRNPMRVLAVGDDEQGAEPGQPHSHPASNLSK